MTESPQTPNTSRATVGMELLGHSLDWWNGALLLSLAIAAFAAFAVVAATTGVIIVQKRDARASAERVAKLEKEAAEARLEVQKLRTPRSLSITKITTLDELAKKYRGTNVFFSVAAGDAEATSLMVQIGNILRTAGWNWIRCPGTIVTVYPSNTPPSCQTALFGNVIQSGARLEGIRDELVGFFKDTEIATRAEPGPPEQDAIHILVGTKPR